MLTLDDILTEPRSPTGLSPLLGTRTTLQGVTRRWFSYEDIETFALYHRREILDKNYLAVVGLARGGLYLATMVSQMTDLPLGIAFFGRASNAVSLRNIPEPAPNRRVLLG